MQNPIQDAQIVVIQWPRFGPYHLARLKATAGLIHKLRYRSDLLGIGFNWGDPPDDSLPEQKTLEAFWNIQFAQNLALTPSFQSLLDPANNPDEDQLRVFGLRLRTTL